MKSYFTTFALLFSLPLAVQAQTKPAPSPAKEKAAEIDPKFAATMKAQGYSPIKLTAHGPHFFIDVSIDEKKGTFLLDTGAMFSGLNEKALKKYKLETSEPKVKTISGVGGQQKVVCMAKTKTLKCGNSDAITQSFFVLETIPKSKAYKKNTDGVLGTDFLKAQKALIDSAHGLLWIKKASAKVTETAKFATKMKPHGYQGIKFDINHNHLFTNATIDGKKARFLIDSGAMVCIFKKSAVKNYNFQIIKGRAVINGVGGPVEIKALAKTKQLKIDTLAPIPMDFYVMDMSKWPAEFTKRLDGILGNNYLKSRKAIVDYERNMLWLKAK